jgi:hypothetical protein
MQELLEIEDAPASEGQRRQAFAQTIQNRVAQGSRIESQSDTYAVLVRGHRVNHVLHLILTLVTLGFWAIVWIALAIFGGEKRDTVSVDAYGQPLVQQL